MHSDIKYYPVNWMDGMRIGKSQFDDSNSFILDHLRDAICLSLNNLNYGLLHTNHYKDNPSLKMSVQFSNNAFIEVQLEHCKASCPDGTRIDVQPVHKCHLKTSFQTLASSLNLNLSSDNYFYIVVQVNQHNRRPFGEPNPEEVPPRHPYTIPNYQISVVPIKDYEPEQGYRSQLPIGKIGYINGHLVEIPGYVPPCMTVGSHIKLNTQLKEIREMLNRMEQSAYKVIQRAYQKGTTQSVIAANISGYCKEFIRFHNQHMLFFQWIASNLPPVFLAETLGKMWVSLRAYFEMLPVSEREETMDYLSEWMNIGKGDLDQRMFFFKQAEYNHNDLGTLFVNIVDNIRFFEELFSRLSQLEFIGKRRGQSLLINERGGERERKSKRDEGFNKFSSLME